VRRVLAVLAVAAALVGAALAVVASDGVDASPGEVVDAEGVVLPLADRVLAATRVTYGSTGARGEKVEVSGIVAAPPGEPPPGGWPIISWAHPTTGGADECAPSNDDRLGEVGLAVAPFVDAGFVVAATDYVGLGTDGPHPYLHGPSEAAAMTDAVRAARRLVPGTSRSWAAVGHSQGGHAALFAAELAPRYAPELDLVGVAALAPPSDLHALVASSFGALQFRALLLTSWLEADPDADEDELTDAGREAVEQAEEVCLPSVDGQLLEDGAEDFDAYLAANAPGQQPTDVPILLLGGERDELVTPTSVRDLAAGLCQLGDAVDLIVQPGIGHVEIAVSGTPVALDWIRARLAGDPTRSACRIGTGSPGSPTA
jgi:pimeloyl-ACP methyl ester carboxylesterase